MAGVLAAPLPSFSFLGVLSPFMGVAALLSFPFFSGLAGVPFASFLGVFCSCCFCFFGVEFSLGSIKMRMIMEILHRPD